MNGLILTLASLPFLWGVQAIIDRRLDRAYQAAQERRAEERREQLKRARAIVRAIEADMMREERDG